MKASPIIWHSKVVHGSHRIRFFLDLTLLLYYYILHFIKDWRSFYRHFLISFCLRIRSKIFLVKGTPFWDFLKSFKPRDFQSGPEIISVLKTKSRQFIRGMQYLNGEQSCSLFYLLGFCLWWSHVSHHQKLCTSLGRDSRDECEILNHRWYSVVFMVLVIVINLSLTNFENTSHNCHHHWSFWFSNLTISIAIIMEKYNLLLLELVLKIFVSRHCQCHCRHRNLERHLVSSLPLISISVLVLSSSSSLS